jgi:hypothetical protein
VAVRPAGLDVGDSVVSAAGLEVAVVCGVVTAAVWVAWLDTSWVGVSEGALAAVGVSVGLSVAARAISVEVSRVWADWAAD